ncbi:Gfo/Idh/MocA family oxidoreductase [Desemzia sp. C1]|uniref:Gfo/Idh/MocA family protein n=1 Tax=Desemzia sp. C1 TaxID=2892016 RepID=UPI001E2D10D6|nr:Gfo/Idh/MocA family oxidoreductase [Desemzia sp. C1]MCI3029285.1 Gfo/Idh/MocA family oxidoreductase [Desemzia sp. C1]
MKIGIIGLGDIAKKAYLPVLTEKEGIELALCTRNLEKLEQLAKKYRLTESVTTVEELIKSGIQAAFVSAATEAHFELTKKLLENGIHVYVDKPLSFSFEESQQLVDLAKEKNLIAMVGFNRRFSPMISRLKDYGKPDLVFIQKNRFQNAQDPRTFVVEDFIHVVDTLRFLMDREVVDSHVRYLEKDGLLQNVVLELIGDGCTAIGIMNKNGSSSNKVDEKILHRLGNLLSLFFFLR